MSDVPLPNADGSIWVDGMVKSGYTFQTMKAYAAAVSDAECAPLVEEIEALRQDGSKLSAENARLREALKIAIDWLHEDCCPLGWNVSRLKEVLKGASHE